MPGTPGVVLGRDRELAVIREFIDEAAGSGAALLLSAEWELGKTEDLSETRRDHPGGATRRARRQHAPGRLRLPDQSGALSASQFRRSGGNCGAATAAGMSFGSSKSASATMRTVTP